MRPAAFLLLLCIVTACFFPTEACGCTPAAGFGYVSGVVTRGDSAVSNAVVRADVLVRGCNDPMGDMNGGTRQMRTNVAGEYFLQLISPVPTDSACIRIVARAGDAATDSVVADRIRMRLVSNHDRTLRRDSVRIDLQLP